MPKAPSRTPRALRESPRSKYPQSAGGRLLLDTHTFLWFVTGSDRLSAKARRIIEGSTETVFVSAASTWEISIKRSIGKLPESVRFTPSMPAYLREQGFTDLPITSAHTELAGDLPGHHRDPFDRLLIAQARLEDLEIVTNDRWFDRYDVRRIW